MAHVPSEQRSPASKSRAALRWGLVAILLLFIVVAYTLVLNTRGPGVAGPGGPPAPTTEEPSSPAQDDPGSSAPPTDGAPPKPTDDQSDSPTTTDNPSPPSSPSSAGGPVPAAPGELDAESAVGVVSFAIDAPWASADTPDALDKVLADVAVEGYAAELEAQWLELTSQGWSITGSSKVESLEITALDADSAPASAEVVACIDSSGVTVLDAAGDPVGDASAASPRALHNYTMIQADDGIWRVSSHSFPHDPSC